jgi:hypothetical protein
MDLTQISWPFFWSACDLKKFKRHDIQIKRVSETRTATYSWQIRPK